MGWAGIRLKPSTVLVFSVALGIAIDVTIRFLVNYKQELAGNNYNVSTTVIKTRDVYKMLKPVCLIV